MKNLRIFSAVVIATIIGLSLFLALPFSQLTTEVQTSDWPGRNFNSTELEQLDKAIDFLTKMGETELVKNIKDMLDKDTDEIGSDGKPLKRLRSDVTIKGDGQHEGRTDPKDPKERYSVIRINTDGDSFKKNPDDFDKILRLAVILTHEKAHEADWKNIFNPGTNYPDASVWGLRVTTKSDPNKPNEPNLLECKDNNWIEIRAYYTNIFELLLWKERIERDKHLSQEEKDKEIKAILKQIEKLKKSLTTGTRERTPLEKGVYSEGFETLKEYQYGLPEPLDEHGNLVKENLQEYQEKLMHEVLRRLGNTVDKIIEAAKKKREFDLKSSQGSATPGEGGKIENRHEEVHEGITSDYVASVEIPAGVLGMPFEVTVTLLDDSIFRGGVSDIKLVGPVYEFEPHGLSFPADKLAIITLPYHPNADLRAADVYRFNELGEWERITHGKTIDHLNRTISVRTDHLSIYAVGAPVPAVGGVARTVTYPNGGENWAVGSTQRITWSSVGVTGKVRIQLSRNGGPTWKTIIRSTPNDGSQAWKVTGPATTQARIKVVSISTPKVFDISDANFTIRP